MSLPTLPELVAAVLAHAVRDEGVLAGSRAMLYAMDGGGADVQRGTRTVDAEELEQAVVKGKLLLALSETPRTALCYLSVLQGPAGPKVGLQVDVRGESPQVASFGAPLGVKAGRPAPEGELWALNEAASGLLGAIDPN